ncbi:phytanoyl-CoA dioxygenase family protein [Streptomyces silvisoli]|uniref:Phytanoyl-CoA dioxygenase family protein n=1 Tax=Streptomyces silvisoli TaxID=3034235 RepID=A0ABT5ZKE5_9ACTN|nr:phytanoyl-CoA dioxygenase family protein [Streptomyces silvisoli]MDF3290294.1 phytanoyl-CoA dioxygenase family protein [Streptomyces silvisoli]
MESEIRRFIDDGYVIVRGIFSEEELAPLRAALARVRQKVDDRPHAYETRFTTDDGTTVDTWGVNHVFSPELYEGEFSRVFERPDVMDLARALLGERLRFWGGHALWAPRSVRYELNWHRDFGDYDFFQPNGESTHVQFNVCLLADACFRVIPGSHRRPLTAQEAQQQAARGTDALPGEVVARCEPGDVLFMNAHTLHRGSCEVGTLRQTLHLSLQPFDEPTGGHTSWRFMRADGYLDMLSPAVQDLMRNSIAWDDAHPLSLAESLRRTRAAREIKKHRATS